MRWRCCGSAAGNLCAWDGTVLTLLDGADIAVRGTVTGAKRIEVAANATATITLNGVSMTGLANDECALLLNSGAKLKLILPDGTDNTLGSGLRCAGIQTTDATLTIEGGSAGTGKLTAKSGGSGGSGSGSGGAGGEITISGGEISAVGGQYGAGIGGGFSGSGGGDSGDILIYGEDTIVSATKGSGTGTHQDIGHGRSGADDDVFVALARGKLTNASGEIGNAADFTANPQSASTVTAELPAPFGVAVDLLAGLGTGAAAKTLSVITNLGAGNVIFELSDHNPVAKTGAELTASGVSVDFLGNTKSITSIILAGSAGVIDEALGTIALTMPHGTDATSLTPTITHTGASISPTGAQNFAVTVTYTVTAADGSTKTYAITVTVAAAPPTQPSGDKAITAFDIAGVSGAIDEATGTITLTMPHGTDATSLTPTITPTGANISPTGAQNFAPPVTYTVTAADGSAKTYAVTVTVDAPPPPPPSGDKAITAFDIAGVSGAINEAAGTIALTMPHGTDATSLTPTITHTGASIAPTGAQDFAVTVTYTVTAADSSTKTYAVTVAVDTAPPPPPPPPPPRSGGSYGGEPAGLPQTHAVTFEPNGGTPMHTVYVENGGRVAEPAAPTKKGFAFDGWHSDEALTIPYDFALAVNSSLTLHAKWTAPDEPDEQPLPFSDALPGDWFHDAAMFVLAHGLMLGTADGEFSPHMNLSRAMIVTILHRIEGEPDATALDNPFLDVPDDEWYADAVIWAAHHGIVLGYGDGRFGPDDPVTREQAAALVRRLQQTKGMTPEAQDGGRQFGDIGEVSDWALEPVLALNAQGLFDDIPGDSFNPQQPATRAEIASILHRLFASIDAE